MWQVEIYPKWFSAIGYRKRLKELGAREHNTKQKGHYWTVKTEERRPLEQKIKRLRVKQVWVEIQWTRAYNARTIFFQNNKPPYRCRYCNRRLKKEYLQVDHLVPVQKAEHSYFARLLLRIQGIKNVNDPRNLVAACGSCNQAKRDKLGFWFIKGMLGKYKFYWIFRKIILVLIAIFTILYIFFKNPSF